MILFFFYLIIWWGIGIASESKLEVLKDGWLSSHNCYYYFLIFCLIILFYYYSNIPYGGITTVQEYVWENSLNLQLALAFLLTLVFDWRWTHTRRHWIISSMASTLKIMLWMFQKMCISEFDILFVIYFYLLIWKYFNLK
jgi:hypothetical protein